MVWEYIFFILTLVIYFSLVFSIIWNIDKRTKI